MFIIFIAFVYQGVCHAVCGGSEDSLWEFVTPSTVSCVWIELSLSWLALSPANSSQGSQESIFFLYFQEDLKT